MPFPLGYLNAHGLSLISTDVFIIFTNSASSLASDEAELVKMINTSVEINDKPCAFRYPRGNGTGVQLPDMSEKIQIGKAKVVREGKKIAILNFGARLNECLIAEENLRKKGVTASIVDARFAKPLEV